MQHQVWIVVKPDPGKPSLTGIGPLVDGSVVPGGCLGVLLRRYVSLGDLCGTLAAVAVALAVDVAVAVAAAQRYYRLR
jgi:hypothetical protein